MKTLPMVLGLGVLAIAACFSRAGEAQQTRRIENWVLSNGQCHSPQDGDNQCNLTERYRVLWKRRICSSSCGIYDGWNIMEIWQIEVDVP